ncbi:MAG: UbiA family prenyltransferase [Methanomicrobiales archaeon]
MNREQKFPLAQLIGRTDFALFPVAGYRCVGGPDLIALMFFAIFYPFALAHLGANDLIDIVNDRISGMDTIPTFFILNGTALLFMTRFVWISLMGFVRDSSSCCTRMPESSESGLSIKSNRYRSVC